MSQLTGQTTARYGSPYRTETLAGATLVFYLQGTRETGTASSRWGWQQLPGNRLPASEIGRATVQANGSYDVELRDYREGGLVVALEVRKFDYAPATGKEAAGLLGVGTPRQSEKGISLDVELPTAAYCDILKALDLWLVAGRVSDCGKPAVPLGGANVTSFDRDLTQDDNLGTAATDAGGNFEIYFPGSVFRQIPALPPPFDAISPFELIGGPDIYFKVEVGGVFVLDEPSATGRTPGRENRSNCSFTELCVQAPTWTPQTITLWSYVGNYQVPDGGGLHDFGADGLTASGKLAFTGFPDFIGQVSQKYLGEAVSFRFVYAEWTDLAVAPVYPGDFTQQLKGPQITSAPYGAIYTFIGPHPWNYSLTPVSPAPDANGWIAVEQSPNFVRDTGRMIQLDSTQLVQGIDESGPDTAGAGLAVPGPNQDRPRKFSFVLEVKTASSSFAQTVPVVLHLNNSLAYLRYNLQELAISGCNPISPAGGVITVHPQYSVGHPYLNSYSIGIQRQDGIVVTPRSDSFGPHGVLWTGTAGEFDTFLATYNDVAPCSYRSWITCDRRLTDGYSGTGNQEVLRTFCTD
ncbi:MAG TPA: hypothetical protein VF173_22160 [Thermoanaerobaculia bacterium]|nr:hypothetical protein [Thermoanaerobaculia bacterium]